MGTLGTLRGERQGETVQIDDRAGGSQKVHAEDATESEAVVHLADLQLEVIEAMAANRKPVDLANKTYSRPPTPRSILSRSPWLAKMPASPAMSAFSTELAAPVSTRTSGTVMIVPMCVTVAVTNTSSPRSVSCAEPTNTDPAASFDVQLDVGRVDEAELPFGMLPVKSPSWPSFGKQWNVSPRCHSPHHLVITHPV
jgi:hypothetical protein